MSIMVRLKPFNPRRKHHIRVFVHALSGKKFEERNGWYKVDDGLAVELKKAKQVEGDEYSPDAFDIVSFEEALQIDRDEKKLADKKSVEDANDMTGGRTDRGRRRAEDAVEVSTDRFAAGRATRAVGAGLRGRAEPLPEAAPVAAEHVSDLDEDLPELPPVSVAEVSAKKGQNRGGSRQSRQMA